MGRTPQVSVLVSTIWLMEFNRMLITDQQSINQSASLLAPPQLTGEQHAYIPYKVAKDTIAKVIIAVSLCFVQTVELTHGLCLPACRSVMKWPG